MTHSCMKLSNTETAGLWLERATKKALVRHVDEKRDKSNNVATYLDQWPS